MTDAAPPQRSSTPRGEHGPRPRFSIVSAVYNVEPYLADYIDSIEHQQFDHTLIEVIAVDDGSTDGSLELLEQWRDRSAIPITILEQANAGPAAARNRGLGHARGTWVTFTDPDDTLDERFFAAADRFARAHPEVDLMASRVLRYDDEQGELRNVHARRTQFARGDRVVDLRHEANVFTSSTVAMFRLDRLNKLGVRYDERVRPTFEDGHFTASFILGLDVPRIGLVRSARYHYRRRETPTSASQTAWSHPGRYADVFDHGYLDVIRRGRDEHGRLPEWLQHVLIYELSWYLSEDEKIRTQISIADEVVPAFHERLAAVMKELDPEVIERHKVRKLPPRWRYILAHAGRGRDWHSTPAVTEVDRAMRLKRVVFHFIGRQPTEAVALEGHPVQPAWTKTQSHIYFRRPLMYTRILWVPLDSAVALELDGRPASIRRAAASGPRFGGPDDDDPIEEENPLVPGVVARTVRRARLAATRLGANLVRREARSAAVRARYRDAWVLMDRPSEADDNAERLFEYLREHRPDVNAWFAISAQSPDHVRLRSTYGHRVVARGTRDFRLLMLNASWLISSHADRAVTTPAELDGILKRPNWRYAFLQHGVIKDDLSTWLNRKQADLFVVSTQPELASVAGDGTAYRYTHKETRNTGLPRFDRLLRKAREMPSASRDLLLIAPTWRDWLTSRMDEQTFQREIDTSFWNSEYLHNWTAILRSPEIADAADRARLAIGFMPHPVMQPVLPRLDLPAHVRPLTFLGSDVQGLYARCALLVTDYSSVAFNVAYVDGPIVYFQSDREAVFQGRHLGRSGYFDYRRDGFGPVTTTISEAVAAIVQQIDHGPKPAPDYQARIDATFQQRDGGACERVVGVLEEMGRPYRWPPEVQAILDRRRRARRAARIAER